MGAVGRIILIVVVIAVIAVGAGFFLLPNTASRTETLTIERPSQTVFARLASTPVGTQISEGVTVSEPATAADDTVTVPVTYADGATGRVVYTVTPEGDNSQVQVRLEQDLGTNPMARFTAIGGGPVSPLIEAAAASVSADLTALPSASFQGLQYVVETLAPRPFFYAQSCVPNEPESITTLIADAKTAIEPLMRSRGLTQAGPLTAVEPRVVENQYCFQIGYPFTGRAPGSVLGQLVQSGQTPGGQVLHMTYTGTEADVLAQVYDPMDALLAAAHIDNPGTREDDWTTFEVYNDDPTQAGGSRSREIYYVVPDGVDIAALTAISPAAQALPTPAPAQPADATAPPAGATPAPATPAPTPAPATP
jgi:hypothetical protein